jgi:hypothetical protein
MRNILKSTVIALALAGAALATTGPANAQGYGDNGRVGVQIDLGNVAVGYRDGYWDRNHHWNRWRHRHDYRFYLAQQGAYYRDWNHDRDGGDGWVEQGGYRGGPGVIQIDFGTVAFGYRDGYWDNGHQWHRWHNDGEYRAYRDRQGSRYRDWNHDRDGGDGWIQPAVGVQGGHGPGVVQIDFGTIAFGYRDGYWDNGHQWHRWHNDDEYRNYRNRQGNNYHDWNHDRDHDMGWQR